MSRVAASYQVSRACGSPKFHLSRRRLILSNEAATLPAFMLNAILSLFRMIPLILGGYGQVALGESRSPRTVGNFPAKRSPPQDSTNRPTVLGVSAESLEGVEVRIGDCPARDRPRLAKEAFPTLLVPIITAQESRPASDPRRHPKTGEDDGRSQRRLGSTKNSWGTA